MYHFVDLTKQQKLDRRENLDFYALVAQVSVLVPLMWIQCAVFVAWLRRRWRNSIDTGSGPSSPYMKHSRLEHGVHVSGQAARWRTFVWWLGDSVDVAGYHVGKRGEVLGAVGWMGWLLVLSFLDTGDDYLHLTKRFGIVAASQMPFHYLLSLKSPWSPLQMLTRRSHESLISIHQLLGRIITVLIYCHVVLYLNFYIQSSILLEKLTQAYILCGIFAAFGFTAVGTTALKPLRDWNYRIFYWTHILFATALLPILWFHVHHIRTYIYQTTAILTLHHLLRLLATKTTTATIRRIPTSALLEITTTPAPKTWHPSQHAYIALPGPALSRPARTNPFTLTSIPPLDPNLRFLARPLHGNTVLLAQSPAQTQLTLEGPYGLATHPDTLLRFPRVLFVAGGVGATFVAPLYRQLLADLSPSQGSERRQRVRFVWVAKSRGDVEWALPGEEREREGFVERLQVYLTRDVEGGAVDQDASFAVGGQEEEGPGEEGIELEERKNLLGEEVAVRGGASQIEVRAGRPDLGRIVEQTFSYSSTEEVAVVVCGPRSLSRSLRREVGKWVGRGRDVWFWEEAFST